MTQDLAVIVEGYMDVMMSHQVGVCNVVAGMGTALTEAQMRQLKRYSNNITLALDPDAAGDHATLRGLEAARQSLEREWEPVISPTGLVRQESRLKAQLRIAALPDGLDPDELALCGRVPLAGGDRQRPADRRLLPGTRGQGRGSEQRPRQSERGGAHGAPDLRNRQPGGARALRPGLARLVHIDERLVAEQVRRRDAG